MATSNPFGDPQTQALLGLAQGLLAAGAPSPFPTNVSGALAQGVGGALSGAMNAQKYNLAQTQAELMKQQLALMAGKVNFLNGIGGQPTQPNAAAGGTAPSAVISNPSANEPFGVPVSGPNAPQNQPAPAQPGFPQVPGLNDYLSRGAALGYLAPGYVSAVASANAPTDFQKMQKAAAAGDLAAKAWINKQMTLVNRGFGLGQIGANGQYIPDLASEGQIARTEGIKAGYETVPTIVNGKEVPTFKSQLPGFPKQENASAVQPPAQTKEPVNPAFADIPKLEAPKGFGMTPYQKGRQEGAATLANELSKKNADAAAIANERLVYNSQALDLLDKATTGQGALSIANVKNFLNSRLGVPLDLMDKAVSGDANATTALNKDLINAATQKAKQAYGSRITQSEVMLQIKQASPNVDQMTATIRYLLQTDSAMTKYQIDKAQYLGGYLQNGGDPYQFEGFYGKKFPMSGAVQNIHLPGSYSQADLEYTAKKYNIPVDEVKRRLGAQ